MICSSAIECFLNFLDLGLRSGGGIGDVAPRISYKFDNKIRYFQKLFLDVIFSILVNLILGNIFFGVIVDTFNEMRGQNDIKTADVKNKCFICHRDRYESICNENFDFHREHRHGLFNYVYFIPYLLKKNPQIYSRAEQFAWLQISMKKIDWYPCILTNDENEKGEQGEK